MGLNRCQTLLQTRGIILCKAMATGKWEAVPALQLERQLKSACCLSPGLKVIIPELLWGHYKTFLLHPVQHPAPTIKLYLHKCPLQSVPDGTGYKKAHAWEPQWLTTTCPTPNRIMQGQPKSFWHRLGEKYQPGSR